MGMCVLHEFINANSDRSSHRLPGTRLSRSALNRSYSLVLQQNRVGSKFGGGGVAGASETNVDRRERLRKLALETIDLAKVRVAAWCKVTY